MAHHVGDGPVVRYTPKFFDWLGQHIVSIKDFAYEGIDYRGDPNIPLPSGAQWGDQGENFSFLHVFNF